MLVAVGMAQYTVYLTKSLVVVLGNREALDSLLPRLIPANDARVEKIGLGFGAAGKSGHFGACKGISI